MKSAVDVDDRIVVSAVSAQLPDNRANGSKPCPVGGAHVIIIVIQVFGVPTQLVQVSEANRINVAAGVRQPGEGYRRWFRVQLRADGDGGAGRLRGCAVQPQLFHLAGAESFILRCTVLRAQRLEMACLLAAVAQFPCCGTGGLGVCCPSAVRALGRTGLHVGCMSR